MDQDLLELLDAWWGTGDLDAARVVADRLQELPSEKVARTLLVFRNEPRPCPPAPRPPANVVNAPHPPVASPAHCRRSFGALFNYARGNLTAQELMNTATEMEAEVDPSLQWVRPVG